MKTQVMPYDVRGTKPQAVTHEGHALVFPAHTLGVHAIGIPRQGGWKNTSINESVRACPKLPSVCKLMHVHAGFASIAGLASSAGPYYCPLPVGCCDAISGCISTHSAQPSHRTLPYTPDSVRIPPDHPTNVETGGRASGGLRAFLRASMRVSGSRTSLACHGRLPKIFRAAETRCDGCIDIRH